MLEVLSTTRDLNECIREEEQMLNVAVEELPSYELVREKLMAKGMSKGVKKGDFQARCRIALNLFGLLPDTVIADKTGLTLEQLEALKHRD